MSQGSFSAPNIGSKWVPNRIIDAEGVRKALDRHLGGYHSALGAILAALGRVLRAIRSPKGWPTDSSAPTAGRPQPAGRGWGGDKSLSPGTGGEEGFEEGSAQSSTRPEARGLGGLREAEGVYDCSLPLF